MTEESIFDRHPSACILHVASDWEGLVVAVFEVGTVRHYWADEYTDDAVPDIESGGVDHNVIHYGGYHTTERACYMGQRYMVRGLWGPYFDEVFTHCKTVYDPATGANVPEPVED